MSMQETAAEATHRIRRFVRARRLPVALGLAICGALVLTAISLTIYKLGGFYRYDLSRPGYEKERTEISTTPTDVTYDTTSPLTKKAMEGFLSELDGHRKNLEDYNAFGRGGLSDEDLQLTGGQSQAPQ